MCLNTESIFTEIHLPKPKPFLIGILYKPTNEIDFVNCIDQIFSKINQLEIQECYLLGDFCTTLVFKGEEIAIKLQKQPT